MTVRTLLKNFGFMATLRVGLAAFTFALFWFMSHHLSIAQLGGFSLLMNTFIMVQALPLLGMTMPLMRRIASRPQDAAVETSNAYFFAQPVGVVIGLGVSLTGLLYADDRLLWPFILLGVSILPTAWTVVAESVLVGREEVQSIVYTNLLESMGRLICGWVVITSGLGLTGVFGCFLLLRCAVAFGYRLNARVPAPRWHWVSASIMRRNLRETPTYLSIALVTALCTRLDIIMLAKLLSLREVGEYAAAARLSDAALMIPTMVAVVIFPSQSRLFASDRIAFAGILERAVRWCAICGFTLTLLVIALAPMLVHLVYAPALVTAAPILQRLILGATLMVMDQLLSTTMMAAQSQQADLRSMTLGLAALVTFLLAFTHYFGLLGAALAVPGALLLRILYRLWWAQNQFLCPVLGVAVRVILAAACSLTLYFFHWISNDVMNLAVAFGVYMLSLWITGSVPAIDRQALRLLLYKAQRSRA